MDADTKATISTAYRHVSHGLPNITRDQLRELLYVLGCKPLMEETYFNEILAGVDPQGTEKITLERLLAKLSDMMTVKCDVKALREALAVFDDTGSGKVDKAEVTRALAAYSNLPKGQIESLVGMKQGGASVDIEELLKKLTPK